MANILQKRLKIFLKENILFQYIINQGYKENSFQEWYQGQKQVERWEIWSSQIV